MLKALTIVYFAAVIIAGYHLLLVGWLMLIPPCLLVMFAWVSALSGRPLYLDELSPEANRVLRKHFPHYFLPNTFSHYSLMAILSWMSAFVFAVIGILHGLWWGVLIAIATFVVMQALANRFHPTDWSINPEEQVAHSEIVEYFKQQQAIRRHEILMFMERHQAKSGKEDWLFGTKWFISMSDVRFLLPYAEPSVVHENELWHAGKIDGRLVGFAYHFENDSLTKISVYFQGYGSTVEYFHRVQSLLSKDYCQMSAPCPSDRYALFSRGEADVFSVEHFFWNCDENQNGEGIIFLPPSREPNAVST